MSNQYEFAIIGGSSLLKSDALNSLTERKVNTEFGVVSLQTNGKFLFCQRHKANPDVDYTQPAKISFVSIAAALQKCGVKRVIAFGSTGTCSEHINVGELVVPDDYFSPFNIATAFDDFRSHIVPAFDAELRSQLIDVVKKIDEKVVTTATYVQSRGPRFETPAEVRWMSTVGDLIGMTCATESTLIQEREIAYALVCTVDNVGNGLKSKLSLDEFHDGVAKNQKTVNNLLSAVIAQFT